MPRFIDMSGQTFGRLTVLSVAERGPRLKWLCQCACGNQTVVATSKIRSGHTRSCGCMIAEHAPPLERFAEKVALQDDGCIVWLGGLNGVGYGQFYVGKARSAGDTGKGYAHRWSYEYHVGPIPEGLHLDHLCRNRACVNPEHLEPVTPRENLMRGESPSAANQTKTHCPAGHPYSGDNLYINPTKGQRICRECNRKRNAERYRRTARSRKAA